MIVLKEQYLTKQYYFMLNRYVYLLCIKFVKIKNIKTLLIM